MKRLFFFLIGTMLAFLVSCTTEPEEDRPEWSAAEVCPEMGMNSYGMPNRGTFTDERDGQVYKYTTIGNQVWMAENLRYDAPYSMCSNDTSFIRPYCELIEHNCETEACCRESLCRNFGRYYSIIEGGAEFGLIDSALADTICPKGWHVPTKDEWEILEDAMKVSGENGSDVATRMKSADSEYFAISKSWLNAHDRMGTGMDDCALEVLPSGSMYASGSHVKTAAVFVVMTQKSSSFGYTFWISDGGVEFFRNSFRNSIRCVMD